MLRYDPELDVYVRSTTRCACGAELDNPLLPACPACLEKLQVAPEPAPGTKNDVPSAIRKIVRAEGRDYLEDPQAEARAELARRELARRHLIPYVKRFMPAYVADWVHVDLAARLERFMRRVERQESPRLIINVPPRVGKSLLASQFFPAWVLGHHPQWEFISTSHTLGLQLGFSRKVRAQLEDPRYHLLFENTRLDPDNRAATGWRTTAGGGFLPAGIGGSITGLGAHILEIDDFIKNADEARSTTVRDSIWSWYTTTAYTRLAPGGGVLVIATRWHLDDLVGRLEAEMRDPEKDQWEIVRYAALAETDEYRLPDGAIVPEPRPRAELLRRAGESVSPTRWPRARYEKVKATLPPEDWAALYMQQPGAGKAAIFTPDMIEYYEEHELPKDLVYYTTWDLAIGKKETNDFTAGITGGVDANDDLWLVDCVRARLDAWEIVEAIIAGWREYRAEMVGIERSQVAMAIGPFLTKRIEEAGLAGFAVEELPTRNRDKLARCRSIQGRMRQRKVRFPRHAPWTQGLVQELLNFPVGAHDDQVDALAWLGVMLEEMRKPHGEAGRPGEPAWMRKVRARGRGRRSWLAA